MINNVTLVGRLTNDVEVEFVGKDNATARVNNTMALNRTQEVADFIPLTFLGKTAESIGKYGYKGMLVGVVGSLQRDTWQTEEGEQRSKTYVLVNRCVFLSKKEATQEAGSDKQEVSEDDLPF